MIQDVSFKDVWDRSGSAQRAERVVPVPRTSDCVVRGYNMNLAMRMSITHLDEWHQGYEVSLIVDAIKVVYLGIGCRAN